MNEDLILLNTIEHFGFKKLEALLSVFKDTADILKAKKPDLQAAGIDKATAERITALKKEKLAKELRLMEKRGVRAVSIFDGEYPENLKHVYSPPVVIYVKGRIKPEDADAVAIVGSRKPSHYGLSACEKLAEQLAAKGITVISGLARGIDTAAHKGAVKSGRTIAVLGSGLDYIYPPENRKFAEKIAEDGAVISEFPMATPPDKRNFPRRNRVISGLSLGVLVVEASEKSGSLITANFALEQNREVFAVPGRIGSEVSTGTNNLIKEGAKLAENADDIITEIRNNLKFADVKKTEEGISEAAAGQRLTEDEERIKGLLSHDPIYIDELARKSNISIGKVSSLLIGLELKNMIRELPGKNFILR